VRDCVERTSFMRKYKGVRVHAVVTLSDTFMPTRYGGRQRPHFNYARWIKIGEHEEPATLPGPEPVKPPDAKETLNQLAKDARLAAKVVTKMTEPPAQAKTTKPTGPQEVAKPTAKEVTGDEIKY
jgi:hypothetical protein